MPLRQNNRLLHGRIQKRQHEMARRLSRGSQSDDYRTLHYRLSDRRINAFVATRRMRRLFDPGGFFDSRPYQGANGVTNGSTDYSKPELCAQFAFAFYYSD